MITDILHVEDLIEKDQFASMYKEHPVVYRDKDQSILCPNCATEVHEKSLYSERRTSIDDFILVGIKSAESSYTCDKCASEIRYTET